MKWLREPLVHFIALGVGLYLLSGLVGDSRESREDAIVVGAGQVQQLTETFARTWQRPPTATELDGLIEEQIREEVFYREALAMGLERDDTIIRRRLRQKLEFLTEDLLTAAEPTEEELRTFLAENDERFRVAAKVSFEHIYFNRDRRGEAALWDAQELLIDLQASDEEPDLDALGDRLPLPRRYPPVPLGKIGGRFGAGFAERLVELPVGSWAGPVESGYGLHLVRIRELESGRLPPFEDVREAVEREWRAARNEVASEEFYQGLRQRYTIRVERAGEAAESDDSTLAQVPQSQVAQ